MPRSGRTARRRLWVVGAAILRQGACLVTRRGAGGEAAGKWEFPGGKVEPGESPAQALVREIREELGLDIRVGRRLGSGRAVGRAGVEVVLAVYLATDDGREPRLAEHAEARWVRGEELAGLDWAEADRPVVGRLRRYLGAGGEGGGGPEAVG